MAAAGTIDPGDLDLLTITDDVDEALGTLRRYALEQVGLRMPAPRASGLLGERGSGAAEHRRMQCA